jgi:hypothetical protein
MSAEQCGAVSRRQVLVAGGAGVGIAVLAMPRQAQAAAAKLAKAAVRYTDAGTAAGKDCDDCLHYVAAGSPGAAASCRIVEGPISAHGHCIAFTPQRKA